MWLTILKVPCAAPFFVGMKAPVRTQPRVAPPLTTHRTQLSLTQAQVLPPELLMWSGNRSSLAHILGVAGSASVLPVLLLAAHLCSCQTDTAEQHSHQLWPQACTCAMGKSTLVPGIFKLLHKMANELIDPRLVTNR